MLVTTRGLAVALGVSLRTVERMLHDEEIEPVRLRGSVRFYVPDVVRVLRGTTLTRKNGRKAGGEKLKAETLKAEMGHGKRSGIAHSRCEIAQPIHSGAACDGRDSWK